MVAVERIIKRLSDDDLERAKHRRIYNKKQPKLCSYVEVYKMVFLEKLPIKEISLKLSVTRERIYQIKRKIQRIISFIERRDQLKVEGKWPPIKETANVGNNDDEDWKYLSVRASNCLQRAGVNLDDKNEIKIAVKTGKVHPAIVKWLGKKTYREICEAVGEDMININAAHTGLRCKECGRFLPQKKS